MTKPKPKTLADADAALTRATRRLRKANDALADATIEQQRAQQRYFKAQADYSKAKQAHDGEKPT